MKLDVKLPNGAELHCEKPPMSQEKFASFICLAWGLVIVAGILLLACIIAGA